LYIIKKLLEAGAEVSAYDPEAMNNVKKVLKNKIHYAENPYDCLNNADALVIMTEWSIFRTPDFQLIKSDIKDKVIFDGRNLYEVNKIKQLGLKYFSIGRNSI
jgi:UDPglucose 6-dehydrogenase